MVAGEMQFSLLMFRRLQRYRAETEFTSEINNSRDSYLSNYTAHLEKVKNIKIRMTGNVRIWEKLSSLKCRTKSFYIGRPTIELFFFWWLGNDEKSGSIIERCTVKCPYCISFLPDPVRPNGGRRHEVLVADIQAFARLSWVHRER